MKDIKTLNQLAEYINSQEDYPLDVEDICEANGWEICKSDYDIAIDKERNEKLSFTGEGDRVDVAPYRGGARGGAREGAGRNSLYKGEKKTKITLSLTDAAINLLTDKSEKTGVSRSDIINKMIFDNLK